MQRASMGSESVYSTTRKQCTGWAESQSGSRLEVQKPGSESMPVVIFSERYLDHDPGPDHPESPQRLRAIADHLASRAWASEIEWREPTDPALRSPLGAILRCHSPDYLASLQRLCHRGGGRLDADTVCSPASFGTALLAVNGWLDGLAIALNEGQPVFVAARPPGHHALATRAMGFCLLGNAAIAARSALEDYGLERVAILDWDVHHGNGTEALVETDPRIGYWSVHQWPAYPGTGRSTDHGLGGQVHNYPLPPGGDGQAYRQLLEQTLLPALAAFSPQLLIVSAGFDAHRLDPLAGMHLESADYGQFTRSLRQLGVPLLFGLEGGYHLGALAESVAAVVDACRDPAP